VTVTDANGCEKVASFTITEPPALVLSETHVDVSCNGAMDGAIDLTVSGGTSPYSYLWSNAGTSEDLTGLSGGTYSVTVTDDNGCTAVLSITINEAPAIVLTTSGTDPGCNGYTDGQVSVSASGGVPAYAFLWSNGATTPTQSGLAAGTYDVTVTDAAGCTAFASVMLDDPAMITISGVVTDVLCHGAATGEIDLTIGGGTGALSVNWSHGSTSEDQTGLTAGVYSVTVTDANGCEKVASYTITEPPALVLSETHVDVSCNGAMDGEIDLTVSGGTSPYSYLWSNAGTSEDLTGLSGGTYSVTVTDDNGCTAVLSITINEAPAIVLTTSGTDPGCNGYTDGQVSVSASGGVPAYTFLWSNGATTPTQSGLGAGTYDVTVTDAAGCTAFASVMLNDPAMITISGVVTDVLCHGAATGEIDLTIGGGTGALSVNWSHGSTSEDQTGLPAGVYSVTVTDANGCEKVASFTITEPPALVLSETHVDVSCNGAMDGEIDLTVSGGTSPYSYLWSNAGTSEDLTGLSGGTYSVTVTDDNGCTAVLSITINEAPAIVLTTSGTDPGCNGYTDGQVSVSASGGVPAYTFLWSNGATTPTQSGLAAGTYDVTVTDAAGCTAIASVTLDDPAMIAIALEAGSVTALDCHGDQTGSLDISVTGGVGPYQYNWNNGATTQDISGLGAGTYIVTVTDANGCEKTASYTITEPPALVLSETHADVSCNGAMDGEIDLEVMGGAPPYDYDWNNGAISQDLTGLSGGTYTVTVTDDNGCTAVLSITINEAPAIVLTTSGTDPGCNGYTDGQVSVSASGGVPAYTFLWSNGATTPTQSGLGAGTYDVTVTDAAGCTAIASVTLNDPAMITISGVVTDVLCHGAATGEIDLTIGGGTGALSVNWSHGSTSEDQTGLPAGVYSVTVTDANGCEKVASFTITEPPALVLSETHVDVSCNGAMDGAIDLEVTGGAPPYDYDWNTGATSQDLTGLSGGTYTVTVTDDNGCTAVLSITINEAPAIVLTTSGTDPSCNGYTDGQVSVSASGGVPAYTFLWSNGATTPTQSGLGAGTYDVTVTDAAGCTAIASVTLNDPAMITISGVVTDVLCHGAATGEIDLTIGGGTGALSVNWSHGSTSEDQTGLPAGVYSVTVTDANGCEKVASFTIAEPPALVLSETHVDVSCNGAMDGEIDLEVTGGAPPYDYDWNNGAISQDLTGLGGGAYTVTVTDDNGCTAVLSITINEAPAIVLTTSGTDPGCNGYTDGQVSVSASGGVPAYTYIWSNGATTPTQSGLAAGTYDVTVTDAAGCTAIASVMLDDPAMITISGIVTDVLCHGAATGEIDLTIGGGTGALSVNWSHGSTSEDQTGLPAGVYSVTVTDANGCEKVASFTITEPPALVLSETHVDVSCNGAMDGAIDLTVSGGTSPYSYLWSNAGTSEDLTGLSGGTYTVTVTDDNGCTAVLSITINEAPAIVLTTSGTDPSCNGYTDGQVSVSASGGVPAYTFLWSNGATTPTQSGLAAGTYDVTVTDAAGCTAFASVMLDDPAMITISGVVTDVLCHGAATGEIDLTIGGGTGALSVNWSHGSTSEDQTGLPAGVYSVTVTDANGCEKVASFTITEPPALVLSETHVDVSCNGAMDGAIDLTVSGGTSPYSYLWSNAGTSEDLTGLSGGTYTVTVTDDNGCTAVLSITINEAPAIVLTTSGTDPGCNGYTDGQVSVSASGGVPAYTFLWSNGATTPTQSGLGAGTYDVTVTDAAGCTAIASVTLNDPAMIAISGVVTDVLCHGAATGEIDLTIGGGTGALSVNWSHGSTSEDQTGLPAGVYSVTVTDANGCEKVASFTITEPPALVLSETHVDVSCNGAMDGAIDLTVSGGTSPYSYLWSNAVTSEDLTGLSGGTYSVTVTDDNGCTAVLSITINEAPAIVLTTSGTDPGCNGYTDGQVSVSASGGVPAYTYIWSNGATTPTQSGLAAGTYDVTVTDAAGCTAFASVMLDDPAMITISGVVTDVLCHGAATGEIDLTIGGGTGALSVNWSHGSTSEDQTGLPAGVYSVTVTDANGCEKVASFTITEPPALVLSETHVDVSCNGAMDGAIDLTVSGGTSPYSYLWSNAGTSEDLTGLSGGTYSVTVTDDNGCTAVLSITINEAPAIVLTTSGTDPGCNGYTDGQVSVSASGGVPAYAFLWSNGATTPTQSGLAAGTYDVTVTDAAGCTAFASVMLDDPAMITISGVVTDVLCHGAATGEIDLTIGGGTGALSVNWSHGSTSEDQTGLTAGVYSVTVTDANGCEKVASYTITEPPALVLSETHVDVSCNGAMDGEIDLTVSGGTSPYSYLWSNAGTSEDLTGLSGGTYSVTVTDDNGCTAVLSITINEAPAIVLTTSGTDPGCNGYTDGQVSVSASGGVPAYTFLWSNGATTPTQSGLGAGTYDVTVTDAAGCTAFASVMLNDPAMITISGVVTDVLCHGETTGEIDLTIGGGTGALSVNWSHGSTSEDQTGLTAGVYSVTVTDANGCEKVASFTIAEPPALVLSETHVDVSCNGAMDGEIDLTVSGGTSPYSYLWSNAGTSEDLTGLSGGTYTVTVTDDNGCTAVLSITINEAPAIVLTTSGTDPSCNGYTDGQVSVSASGGVPAYTFLWSNGAATQTQSGLGAGTYDVTVTDAAGCTAIASVTLDDPDGISADINSTNVSCNGAADGTATLSSIVGGTGSLSIAWSTGATGVTGISGLSAGAYTVTISDENGCQLVLGVQITEPSLLTAVISAQSAASCNGFADGSATVTASGGTLAYDYDWSDMGTGATRTDLSAGTYTITVTDANGCSAIVSVTIGQATTLVATVTHMDVSCNGGDDGTITVTATGGTTPYEYSLGGGTPQPDNVFSDLSAGDYTVTVTDDVGCTATVEVTITGPTDPLDITVNTIPVSCFGGANGSAGVVAEGGTAPYSYLWSNGSTDQVAIGLSANTYMVTVTDANGCTVISEQIMIDEPASPVQVTIGDVTNTGCEAGSNGSATASATGGVGPYTYLWSNGQVGAIASNLNPGTYTVTATDENDCQAVASVVITDPASLQVVITDWTDVGCYGEATGAATAQASGGTAPYTFAWGSPVFGNTSVTVLWANGVAAGTINPSTAGSAAAPTGTGMTVSTSTSGPCGPDNLVSVSGNSLNVASRNASRYVQFVYNYVVDPGCAIDFSSISFSHSRSSSNAPATGAIYVSTDGVNFDQVGSNFSYSATTCNSFSGSLAISTSASGSLYVRIYGWNAGNPGNHSFYIDDLEINAEIACDPLSGPTITDLVAAVYTVTVTDANGCQALATVEIEEPALLIATATHTDLSCNGGDDGTITVFANGGTTPYTYDAGAGTVAGNVISGLNAGDYTVTVTDDNGCSVTVDVTIEEPADALSASAAVTSDYNGEDISCFGAADGEAEVTATGGTAPYDYLWSTGSTDKTATGLGAGTYTVTVTDANGCTTTASVTLEEPDELTATAAVTSDYNGADISCFGATDGAASVTPTGGTTPYSYLWSTGSTSASATNLGAGSYTVTVTDANGCSIVKTVTLSEPSLLTAVISAQSDASCNGFADGSATVTASGGTPAYDYDWSDGGTGATRTDLSAGTYTITVTDANGCSAVVSVTIGQATTLVATATHTNVSCNGGDDGTITVTATGGTTPYTYDAGAGTVAGNVISGLIAGDYTVTVTDDNGCSVTVDVTIEEPATALSASAAIVSDYNGEDISCFGAADGEAEVTATGGTAPYDYLWSTGSTDKTATGLGAGTYTVTVTDANDCTTTTSVTLSQPDELTATAAVTSDYNGADISCFGETDGSASVTPTGGTTPYSYLWSNGSTLATATGLGAGSYTVTVTDANGCSVVKTVTLSEPSPLTAVISAQSDASCNGFADGSATVTASGGTPAYDYDWSDGGTGATRTDLAAGTYTITVTDANGCSAVVSVTIGQATTLVATATHTDVSCNGGDDGTITVTATGGTTPYTYDASAGTVAGNVISGLIAGDYTVTVTDDNGCSVTVDVTIEEPATALSASAAVVSDYNGEDISCFGAADGEAEVTATGGTAPYDYLWSTGSTDQTATGLGAGTYTVTVTDANGCTTTASVTLEEPDELTATAAVTSDYNGADISCFGATDGEASVTPTGGTTPYSYLWSNGSTSASATNLGAGSYTVTVTDANGCSIVKTVTLSEPNLLTAVISAQSDASCNGFADGSATVAASGGTPAYTYDWSDSGTGATRTDLSAGTYTITVTDANGCSAVVSVTIGQATTLVATATHTDVSCNGGDDGTITVTATGGTTPYTYDAGAGTVAGNVISGLIAGDYTVTVTDDNGCSVTVDVTIEEPATALSASAAVTSDYNGEDISCFGAADGEAEVTATGGTAPYDYLWSTGSTDKTATGLGAGTYSVTVTDANGCSTTASVTLEEPDELTATAAATSDYNGADISCFGATDGAASVTPTGGTTPYSYLWSNGSTSASATNLGAGSYTVTVTDANGCSVVKTVTLSEPSLLTAVISAQSDASCNGFADGSATVTASGGTPAYDYDWSDSGTGATRTDLDAGTYTITVTDANGCSAVVSVTIGQATTLIATATHTDVSCNGGDDGTITVFANGGTTPYTYDAGAGTVAGNVISGLSAGDYTVTVTDDNGCSVTVDVTIEEPADALSASAAVTSDYNGEDISCFGAADGEAEVTATGGTAPYDYLWSTGSTDKTAPGLGAGTYSVTVTDANGCSTTASVTLEEPDELTATAAATSDYNGADISCFGATDGAASVTPTGGTTPYSYLWSNGSTSASATNLGAGSYTVTVTDANGCSIVKTVTLTQPELLTAVVSAQTHVSCDGTDSGSATITANGGTTPYAYEWSDNGTGATRNDLDAGAYTVTVTDANGCSTVVSVVIDEPTLLTATTLHTDVSCFGGDDGSIIVFATGGTTPYSYDAGAGTVSNNVISGLSAGNYTVTVTDGNGCSATVEVTIGQPENPLGASAAVTSEYNGEDISCFGAEDGKATVTAGGGTAPYSYLWSNGLTDQTVMGLGAGTYTVTVTDVNGCTATASVTLTEPEELIISAAVDMDETCPGAEDGQATVTASGGTPNYNYQWDLAAGGQTTATASNLGAGIYSVTVTDANGCQKEVEVEVGLSDDEAPVIDGCPDNITVFTTGPTCDEPASFTIPAVSDNCGLVSYTLTYGNGDPAPATVPLGGLATAGATIADIFAEGQTIVTLTASDAAGNTEVCSFNILVIDNQPPTALCQDITVQLDADGNASITGEDIDDGSFDNCGVESLEADPNEFTCADVGENTVTLIVTDIHGNTKTCTAIVTVEDNVPPVALCMDITVALNAGGNAVINGSSVDAGSDDACGIANLSVSQTAFNCSHVGENEVTLTVTDVNGNTSSCTSTVTIVDNIAPIAICQNATVQLDENGAVTVVPDDVDGGSADACGIATRVVIPNTFGCTDIGANTVTLILTDVNGNSSSCTATVTVQDNVPPMALCQDITVELDETGNASITVGQIDNGSNDACGIASTTLNQTSFDCGDAGDNTVILTVTDVNGNSSTCSATVTVNDVIEPEAVCEDITIQLDADGVATITASDIDGGSTDECGIVSLSASQNVFGCEDVGLIEVTLTVTDAGGNTNTCKARVTVEDNIPPVAACEDITVALDAGGNATITGAQVGGGSTDACGIASFSVSPSAFDCSDLGSNTVTIIVTDVSGNSSACSATVTIVDVTPPTAICQDITIGLDANGLASITAAQVDGGSTDACGVIAGLSVSQTAFDCSNVGDNFITLTVTDGSGNSSSCTATVKVNDLIAPTALCQDVTVNLDANGTASVTAAQINNGSTDNCGIASMTVSPSTFDCSDVDDNIVTLTVTDVNGNSSSCTAAVKVQDNIAPTVVCKDVTVELNPLGTYTILDVDVFDYAGSSDNCGDIRVMQVIPSVVNCDNLGSTIPVMVLVADGQGNTASCVASVTVEEGDLLPGGLAHDDVGNANGDAGFAPCSGLYTVTSQGSITSLTADRMHLVYQQLCGNGEIIVRVESVTNNGWAGISMRESLAPGSIKADLKTQLSTFLRRDVRTVTNGTASSQIIPRPQVHTWLRLVRSGNTITGYSSITGPANWQFTFAANVPMTDCIYVGFFAESINSSPAVATFSNVTITGNMMPLVGNGPDNGIAQEERHAPEVTSDMQDITIYPNPANTEAYVNLEAFRGKSAAIELFNDKGQLLYLWEIDEIQSTERLDIGRFPSGLYLLRIRIDGHTPVTKRLVKQQD
jgi:hypothetical protein